jgi:hypothetical protein
MLHGYVTLLELVQAQPPAARQRRTALLAGMTQAAMNQPRIDARRVWNAGRLGFLRSRG